MKTILSILLAITLVTPAFATQWPDGKYSVECAVVKVTPPDKDPNPGYKVTLIGRSPMGPSIFGFTTPVPTAKS